MNGRKAKSTRRLALGLDKTKRVVRRMLAQAASGQNPKSLRERRHKAKAAIKPTWPKTLDQHLQDRPVIVVRPVRRMLEEHRGAHPKVVKQIKAHGCYYPKHVLDARAF